jgi:hypothetical protein
MQVMLEAKERNRKVKDGRKRKDDVKSIIRVIREG